MGEGIELIKGGPLYEKSKKGQRNGGLAGEFAIKEIPGCSLFNTFVLIIQKTKKSSGSLA